MNIENNHEMYEGIAWRLIVNYLAGENTNAEQLEIEQWIEAEPSRKSKLETLQDIWNLGHYENLDEQKKAAWKYVEKMIENGSVEKSTHRESRIYTTAKQILKVAAAVLIMVGGYYLLQQFIPGSNDTAITWKEKTTTPGQKAILTLFDGTRITLNSGSTLKYPKQFERMSREVYLEGEAYFEVARNSSRPFVVQTSGVTTTVLGTVFNIRAFPEENRIMVSLIDGKIKVENVVQSVDAGEKILSPSQQFTLKKDNNSEAITSFDLVQITGWKNDIYKFENEPLENVFVTLARAYGIKFELADKTLKNKKITTLFHRDSFWTIVKVLKRIIDLEYKTIEKKGELEKIIFYKRKE